MKRMTLISILMVVACALTASIAASQTLAEVAKQEREKQKDQKVKPAKTYTNADLDKVKGGAVSSVSTDSDPYDVTGAGGGETTEAAAEGEKQDQEEGEKKEEEKGEAYWRDRAAQARKDEARAKERLELLMLKQQSLNNQFFNLSDPAQRDLAGIELARLNGEIDEARDEYAQAAQAKTNLEDEARKAGALPGWLRE